MIFTSERLH